jgi:hypothetical protein
MDEEWADEFGLNHAQMRFVQDAVPGNEDTGFSEALLGVDGEWRGIRVEATPKEKAVIDFDPTTQARSSLPGVGDDPADSGTETAESECENWATNDTKGNSDTVAAGPEDGSVGVSTDV